MIIYSVLFFPKKVMEIHLEKYTSGNGREGRGISAVPHYTLWL